MSFRDMSPKCPRNVVAATFQKASFLNGILIPTYKFPPLSVLSMRIVCLFVRAVSRLAPPRRAAAARPFPALPAPHDLVTLNIGRRVALPPTVDQRVFVREMRHLGVPCRARRCCWRCSGAARAPSRRPGARPIPPGRRARRRRGDGRDRTSPTTVTPAINNY